MSLNGTLETFALPDVLALLAATKKTGELQVDGGRGEARLWLDNGEMVGADVPRATTFVDALFEMLRLTSGNFAFDNDGRPASPGDPQPVEPLLLEAKSRLGEWKSIEAVVPSLACAVKLAAEVSGAQVSVTPEQWRALVAVATSRDVEGVMKSLELGEFASCRMLKDLVQIGLVSVEDAPPPAAEAPKPEPATAAAPKPDTTVVVDDQPEEELAPAAEPPRPAARRIGGSTLVAATSSHTSDADAAGIPDRPAARAPQPSAAPAAAVTAGPRSAGIHNADAIPAEVPHLRSNRPAAAAAAPGAATTSPDQLRAGLRPATAGAPTPKPVERRPANPDASDLVHQLAELQGGNRRPSPPKPAAAAPRAAAAPTPRPVPAQGHPATATGPDDKTAAAEAEPATAKAATDTTATSETTDENKGEEPLNRGLLLKFLNSVRS